MRALVLASGLLCAAAVEPPRAATVSFLDGTAQVRRGPGMPQEVRQGSALQPGDQIETGDDSRLELKLDTTVLRLGPRTRLVLPAAPGRGAPAGRQAPLVLLSGKLRASPSDRDLQVETEHALLRARAAGFRLDSHEDHSVLVRVYSGSVAVRSADRAAKQSLTGRAVRPKPWEKTVGKGTQMLIGADGTPGVPAPFTEADEKDDDWAAWNRKRDGQGK